MQVAVLNGVNLGMLGRREPEIYGSITLADLESQVYAWARELGCHARCSQTDHEGEYVTLIHGALGSAGGVIVNPGAWTHYSYAIRDALAMITAPIVEVHLSKVDEREEFRRHSVIADVVSDRITGLGVEGYRLALTRVVELAGAGASA